jgi:hypothetical protein
MNKKQDAQDWQGPKYAHLRPKPLLPDPAVHGRDPPSTKQDTIIKRVLAARDTFAARSAAEREAEMERNRRAVRQAAQQPLQQAVRQAAQLWQTVQRGHRTYTALAAQRRPTCEQRTRPRERRSRCARRARAPASSSGDGSDLGDDDPGPPAGGRLTPTLARRCAP